MHVSSILTPVQKNVTTQSIEINGTKYNSVDEVPAEFKHFFTDADSNGVPDFVDSAISNATSEAQDLSEQPNNKKVAVSLQSNFNINGKNYTSLADVPEFKILAKAFKIGFPFLGGMHKGNPVQPALEKQSNHFGDSASPIAPASTPITPSPDAHYKKSREERPSILLQFIVFAILILLISSYFSSR